MKFFVNQEIIWPDKSKSVKIFDINHDGPLTAAIVKELGRPAASRVKEDEVLIEKVLVGGVELLDDSAEIESLKVEYRAKVSKKS